MLLLSSALLSALGGVEVSDDEEPLLVFSSAVHVVYLFLANYCTADSAARLKLT
jgi:hypothetical protein